MSRMRVLILAVVVGVAMMMPTPMVAWAGLQGQKVAKQEKNAEKKATQHQGEKEKEPGKKDKKSTGNDAKQEQAGKGKEKKTQKEEKSEKALEEKVTLCHKSPDNSKKSITVGAAAVDEHLAHGDTKGPCK